MEKTQYTQRVARDLPQGTGQLIETLYGWTGFGPPWGGNPPANQSRFDAQTYVQFGLTDTLTVYGETAFEHYAIGQPTPNTYNGLDYSGLGLRQKLWSTGEWIFSGEATAFIPGAHDSHAPAQEGNTGRAGKRVSTLAATSRWLQSPALVGFPASAQFQASSTPRSPIGCAPKARRTNGMGT